MMETMSPVAFFRDGVGLDDGERALEGLS